MYISSFHIDGFGIFSNAGVSDLPPGMVIFLGANEAGKSTCLEFIRTMLFGYSNRKMAKRFGEPVNGGRPGGNLVLRVDGQGSLPDEIRLSRRPGKSGGILSLHAPDGTPINPDKFYRLMAGITEDVYRAVYGFSLTELENFACLNEEGVRNALYSASFGPGITAPGEVLKFLAAWQGKLFSPGGKKGELQQDLNDLENLNSRIQVLAEANAGFDAAALELASTRDKLAATRTNRKNLEDERRVLERRHGVWRQWNELRLLNLRLESMPIKAPLDFPEDGEQRLRDLEKDKRDLERQIAEFRQKVASSEEQKKSLVIDTDLADALPVLRRLAERKISYNHALGQIPGEENGLQRGEANLRCALAQLGPDWDCQRIRKTNRSLFAREDLEKQAREMAAAASAHQACVDALSKINREVETCIRAVAATRETLENLPDPVAVMNGEERDELRQNMARLDESIRLGPVRERALENARTSFMRAYQNLHFSKIGMQPGKRENIGELAEDFFEGEENAEHREKECALLDALLDRQDDALALAAEMQEKIAARGELDKALKQAENEAETIRKKMDDMRSSLRDKAGPGREALDARGAALRNLRSLSTSMATEKQLLQELDNRINEQKAPAASKSVPLLVLGIALAVAGAASLLAFWLGNITEFPVTDTLAWPVNLWSGYLVLACGVAFLAGGLPRSGPEAKQFANEMAILQNRRESRALKLAELGDQVRVLCEEAQVDSADPITLDATEVLLEREREKCFHEEQAMQEMEAQQTELARIRTKAQELAVESHDREQEAQQYRRRWHALMQTLHLATVPSPESATTFFARAETARMAYMAVANADNELNQVWDDMHNLEKRIASMPQIARLLQDSSEPLSLEDAVRRILESCREADACRDQRIRAAADLKNNEDALARAQALQQQAAAELKTAEGRLEQSRSTWNQSVAILGLGTDLNPETVREAFKCMENCLQLESRLQNLRTDLERYGSELAALEVPLGELARSLGAECEKDDKNGIDWIATLNALLARAEAMDQERSAASRLDIQIGREKDELSGLEARLGAVEKQEEELLCKANARDAEEFVRLAHARNEELELQKNRLNMLDILKLAAGKQPFAEFLASFEGSNEEDMQARLDEIARELEKLLELEESLASLQARLDAQVAALSHSGELADLRRQKSVLLEKMENTAREWSVPALASAILCEARNVFEKERQPEVISIASDLFASITNGRWKGLSISLEDSTLMVLPQNGEPVPPDYLSRGAQEQAYLALRLAYIKEHSRHAQSLPIIMDEILVNFDPERVKRAARTFAGLVDSPHKQQLLYFTCQPHVAEMLAEVSPGAACFKVENRQITAA